MSHIDERLSNTDVIPTVESNLFDDAPDSRFAIGVIAVGNCIPIGLEKEHQAHFALRRNVYVDQTGQLSREEIGEDGTDRDQDDERSVVFGVVENLGDRQRLVATTRLIVKGLGQPWEEAMKRPLPVESEWPEVFKGHQAQATSFEVSRLISRHEKAGIQDLNKLQLYAAALAFVQEYGLGPAYAIVEDWFERDLGRYVPNRRIGERKFVDHYLDFNIPLEIDLDSLRQRMERAHPGMLASMPRAIGQFAYYGTLHSHDRTPSQGLTEEIA